jgi:cytochrome c2
VPAELSHFTIPGSVRVEEGKRVAERFGCRRCHRLGEKGTRLATDLDRLAGDDPSRLFEAIRQPVLFMPDFRFDDRRTADVVNAVMAFAATSPEKRAEAAPQVVHFETVRVKGDNLFVTKCGGCHRLLTPREGGLGTGTVAPNLSGLFTPFYPTPHKPGEPWTPERLGRWLDNPRAVRPGTLMSPVPLNKEEKAKLFPLLLVDLEH